MHRLIWITLCLVLLFDGEIGWGSLRGKNKKGNALYEKEEYDEALKVYRNAQLESPDSPQLHYNIGNVLYQKKEFTEAAAEYQKTLRSDQRLLQGKTFYNLGNSAYRMGKLQEAIEFYKKALQIKPDDMDAKYNLEFVRKKLEEMAQKQPPQSQESQQENPEGKEGKKQQEGAEEKQRQGEQPKQKEAEQPKEKKPEQPEELKETAGKKENQETMEPYLPQEGLMSKEEAKRLLDALKEQEKKDQKELRRVKARGQTRVDKDW